MLENIKAIEERTNLGGGEKFHFDGVNSFVNWLNQKGYSDKGQGDENQILDSKGTPIGEFVWNKDKSFDVVIGTGSSPKPKDEIYDNLIAILNNARKFAQDEYDTAKDIMEKFNLTMK